MPQYPLNRTYKSGFYNSKRNGSAEDRLYTAEDVRKPYDVVFSDGVKPIEDGTPGNTLKVTATGGMGISVDVGHGKVGGAWFENEKPYQITLDAAEGTERYDCIIIRNDDNDDVRDSLIYVKSQYTRPTVNDLTRSNKIYEICLAYVIVPAFSENITDENIIDTRDTGSLCDVMRGVGAIVVRTYKNVYFTENAEQTVIPIGIPQFSMGRDNLTVVVEGRIVPTDMYTIDSNETITMNIGFPKVGTKIEFEVAKNVNASGADTIVKEVGDLLAFMNSANKVLQYHYYCNGVNDNIVLSEMAQAFLDGSDNDNKKLTIYVCGTIGCANPYSGIGTSADPFVWFRFGKNVSTSRKVVFDFANCSTISPRIEANTYNTIFSGFNMFLKSVMVRTTQPLTSTTGSVLGLDSKGKVQIDSCGFVLWGARNNIVAYTGTFNDCYCSTFNTASHSLTMHGSTDSLFIINGGEYYAYCGEGFVSACIFVESAATNCVVKADKVNCPTYEQAGYIQSQAVRDLSKNGHSSYRDIISILPINAENQLVEGTAVVNKPNRL